MKTLPRITVTLSLSAAALVATIPNASAARVDTRDCVAPIEYKSARGFVENHAATRTAIAAHWETSGRGEISLPVVGTVTRYVRCGYALTDSFVFVKYESGPDGQAWMKGIFVA